MRITAILSTKGGVGKTTTTANTGGLLADAGLRVLLVDLDSQPSLSSYYPITAHAPGGIYELIALNETRPEQIVSRTAIDGLDIVVSNDYQGQLPQLLLNAPDGRFRLSHLLDSGALADYDAILIDTQGARSITLEAAVLAADHLLSPITPGSRNGSDPYHRAPPRRRPYLSSLPTPGRDHAPSAPVKACTQCGESPHRGKPWPRSRR